MISAPDLDLINITDDVDEAVELLVQAPRQREHEHRAAQSTAAAAGSPEHG